MTSLEGQKVNLRFLKPSDLPYLQSWENNPAYWHLSGTQRAFTPQEFKNYLQNAQKDILEAGQLRLLIETKEQQPLGTVDFYDFEPVHQRAGVGILIVPPEERRRGFALEALQMACNFAFKQWGLQQIYAHILEENKASINLFLKLGFEKTGLHKKWVNIKGHFYDLGFYQLMNE
jgi:diamine N-acetyltransferase